MAKLTEKERAGFEIILQKDLTAIDVKFMNQIKDFWHLAREEVLKIKGWDKLRSEREKLNLEQKKVSSRLHEIESAMNSERLMPEQVTELGGQSNEYGRFKGANFYGIPVTSQFEYEIVEYIRQKINLEVPAKILRDICEAALRALTMAGTFEEARAAYEKFYRLNFRKYGVDIPPRLEDIIKHKAIMKYAGDSLVQVTNEEDEDIKEVYDIIDGKKVKKKKKKVVGEAQ